jgi:hypothetical protein
MTILSNRFSKLLAVFGAGALLALTGCREKPKQLENVTANIGVREFTDFSTKNLPSQRDTVAPDGSDVRLLSGLKKGSMIHFELAPIDPYDLSSVRIGGHPLRTHFLVCFIQLRREQV